MYLYESPDDGGLPVSRPFICTHFFYPKFVTAWKFFGLNKKSRKENIFFKMNVLFVKVVYVIFTKICMIMIRTRMELLQNHL